MNNNVCELCIENKDDFNYQVADTGVCGQCIQMNECMDLDLIGTYRSHNISDSDIWAHLPRLRHAHTEISFHLTDKQINRLIERFKNEKPPAN
ncbi:hypothetical protein [Pseudoalteromonas marina]|uniref:Uncharacterized protein n=1 Tax=Pseudoalteromonas marina TaxID=267375 RepID=A0ABT9FHX4_9GAMM|nr:hypothetical protein [Pseudoalteromonas marina]MDP2566398.1 hypothetical protein [Pseudoalteromonas marina]